MKTKECKLSIHKFFFDWGFYIDSLKRKSMKLSPAKKKTPEKSPDQKRMKFWKNKSKVLA